MAGRSYLANATTEHYGDSSGVLFNTCGIIFLVLALFAATGNGFILYVVKRDPLKCFNKPTNVLNISIAATHLFAGAVVLPFLGILNILRGKQHTVHLPTLVITVEDVLVNSTVGTATLFIFAISTERCTAILCPRLNTKWITTKRAQTVSLLAAVICFAFCSALFTGLAKVVFYCIYLHIFILLPVCGIFLSCIARLYTFKQQARISVINSSLPMTQHFALETRKRNSQMVSKLLTTVFTILLPTVLSLLVFYVVKLLPFTCESCIQRPWYQTLYNITLILLFTTSPLNPLVFIARIPEYSRSVKHVLRR